MNVSSYLSKNYLFVDPNPVMNSFNLSVVNFPQEDVFKSVAAQNSAMTRIQFEPNAIQQTAPSLRSRITVEIKERVMF